ncbi:MAG: hypothetical protein AAF830_11310 [Pseudomonadota bacterium]
MVHHEHCEGKQALAVLLTLTSLGLSAAVAQPELDRDRLRQRDRPPPNVDVPSQFPELFPTDNDWTTTTIRCRGGGGTNIGLTSPEGATNPNGTWQLGFWFIPALQGYNQAPLSPGECAMANQPLVVRHRGEPLYRLEYTLRGPQPNNPRYPTWRPIDRIVFDEHGQFYLQLPTADNLIAGFHANQRIRYDSRGNETAIESVPFIELTITRKRVDPARPRPDGAEYYTNTFVIQGIAGYGDD